MAQFIAASALLAVTTWLAHRWFDLFGPDNFYTAGFVGFGLLCLYAIIYDLRQARKLRANADSQPNQRSHES
jgi:hypothetical protein